MAFDHENHMLDPVSGLQVHKDTGHLIGIEQHPPQPSVGTEFPKLVEPHPNHVVWHSGNHVSTPNFLMIDRDRVTGIVKVMVHDATEEAFALADPHAPKVEAEHHVEAAPAAPDEPKAEHKPVNPYLQQMKVQ